jgi:hypothetical protein
MSEKQINGAARLLDSYSEDEIMNSFRFAYGKCPDDFARKQAAHQFFTISGEMVILSLREQKAKQEEVLRKAETLTVPAQMRYSPREEEKDLGDEIDF